MEYISLRALQSHCVIPAQPRDYSSRECKHDEIETQAANDETDLTLVLMVAGCLQFLRLCFFSS